MIDLSRLSNSTILQSLRKVMYYIYYIRTNISFKTNME